MAAGFKGSDPTIWDTLVSKEYEREISWNVGKGFYLGTNDRSAGAFAIRPAETLSAGGVVTTDQWHMLVGVHDPEVGVVRMYVDGQLLGESTANPANFNKPNLAPLVLGAESTDGTIGSSTATIDDLKIYNYALDSTTIAQQYVDINGGYICVGGIPAGDITGDCKTDIEDFAVIATNWLESNRVE